MNIYFIYTVIFNFTVDDVLTWHRMLNSGLRTPCRNCQLRGCFLWSFLGWKFRVMNFSQTQNNSFPFLVVSTCRNTKLEFWAFREVNVPSPILYWTFTSNSVACSPSTGTVLGESICPDFFCFFVYLTKTKHTIKLKATWVITQVQESLVLW